MTNPTQSETLLPWPFFGYAPGNYTGQCHRCDKTMEGVDKNAISCLECAVVQSKRHTSALQSIPEPLLDEGLVIDMVLFCPKCGQQHIDKPDPADDWDNPPHKSHKCVGPNGCGCVWRPADVLTNGVAATKTRGSKDTITYNYAALSIPRLEAGRVTEAMREAGCEAMGVYASRGYGGNRDIVERIYLAMSSASAPDAGRVTMKIIPAEPIKLEDEHGIYSAPDGPALTELEEKSDG